MCIFYFCKEEKENYMLFFAICKNNTISKKKKKNLCYVFVFSIIGYFLAARFHVIIKTYANHLFLPMFLSNLEYDGVMKKLDGDDGNTSRF